MEKLRPLIAGARTFAAMSADVLVPPRCLACGATIGRGGAMCGPCWTRLRFITPPLCDCCGFPFARSEGEDALCADCLREPPPFAHARCALVYDDASRPLILDFKHRDRHEGNDAFAAWMRQAAGPLLDDASVISPVPLHRWRLLRRRYNQSALLAGSLAKAADLRFVPDALIRVRHTPSQGGLSAPQRRLNLQGAIALNERRRQQLDGARVVLVDDVYTTGATVRACARALMRGGVASVVVLTLARVVRAPL